MGSLFISYRRSDSGGEAGRLSDSLERELGRGLCFRDVPSLLPGDRFDMALERAIEQADVVLVLIGSAWHGELERRQALPELDYHYAEVAAALKAGKRVLPVLLSNTAMPTAAQLPDALKPLSLRHAFSLRDEAWDRDVKRLADTLGRPYRFDRLLLRAAIMSLLILVFCWQVLPVLVPGRSNDMSFVRAVLLNGLLMYAVVEAAWAFKHSRQLQALRQGETARTGLAAADQRKR